MIKLDKEHLSLLWSSILGICQVSFYKLIPLHFLITTPKRKVDDTIVSLTSYGDRVNRTVYWTLISLLRQTFRPKKIILWLDENSWNYENVPTRISKLVKYDVEIRFCPDFRSFKKLIPTLRNQIDYNVITVDDDVVYNRRLIEILYLTHEKHPKDIICTLATIPIIKNHVAEPYSSWRIADATMIIQPIKHLFPVGVGSVFYPKWSFIFEDICDDNFLDICPNADDIWFWFMAKNNGTRHRLIEFKNSYYPFDAIYQALHKGTALTHSNVQENKNDLQFRATSNHFKITLDDN